MIREDNVTLVTLQEDLRNERVNLKEYVTRSEGAALFTVAINKHLLNTYKSHPSTYSQIATTITKGDGEGKTLRFPSMFGCNPQYVPELSEIPFGNLDITSTTVEAEKFGLRMGISQEMIDDNEVSLINWTVGRVGVKMSELRDQEFFKCLHTYVNTFGAAVCQDVDMFLGNKNRGAFYTTGTSTNVVCGSAANWEDIINTGLSILKSQTITVAGQIYKYPVYANTILVNSVRELALRKVLSSPTVVIGTGLGAIGMVGGGRNVFNGLLNIVASPYVSRGTAFILEAGRGLIMLDREAIRVDRQTNWAFEAEEVKAITRFMPAVIEERSLLTVGLNTA